MECQVDKREHFRHILLFEFNKGMKAAEAARSICAVYGEDAIGESTARKWFHLFKEGRYNLNDSSRSGRPSGFDEAQLNNLINSDPSLSSRKLASSMNCSHRTILRHLHQKGNIKKSGEWTPSELKNKKTTKKNRKSADTTVIVGQISSTNHQQPHQHISNLEQTTLSRIPMTPMALTTTCIKAEQWWTH